MYEGVDSNCLRMRRRCERHIRPPAGRGGKGRRRGGSRGLGISAVMSWLAFQRLIPRLSRLLLTTKSFKWERQSHHCQVITSERDAAKPCQCLTARCVGIKLCQLGMPPLLCGQIYDESLPAALGYSCCCLMQLVSGGGQLWIHLWTRSNPLASSLWVFQWSGT